MTANEKKQLIKDYITCDTLQINDDGTVYCDNVISSMCVLCKISQDQYNKRLKHDTDRKETID